MISPSKNFNITLPTSLTRHTPGCGFNVGQPWRSNGYLSYADNERIYIFYTNGRNNLTYIDIKTQKHRTISDTTFEMNLMFSTGVRVGHNFYMGGDRLIYCYQTAGQSWATPSYAWRGKREQLLNHSQIMATKYTSTCLASYNR